MTTPVDKLTTGIRLRQARSVEQALREGASPDACVDLSPDEQYGSPRAPVLYLAIHHDFPDAVRLLVLHGANPSYTRMAGLTPRVHAAWQLRWECLEAFDEGQQRPHDDDLVLSAIVSHWAQPMVGQSIEPVFFHRMDRAEESFSLTPDLAMSLMVGVLCGWEGYRVAQLQRLLGHARFQRVAGSVMPAILQTPDRFTPYYVKMHSQARRFLGGQPVPDQALEMLARLNIPLAPPAAAALDPEASAWLSMQQARSDALTCSKALDASTPEVAADTRQRGRL